MEDVALTTFSIRCPPRHLHHGSLLLSLHKGIKLKSNIAGNSFYFFPLVQAVKNGESEIKTLTETDMSL